jgi:clan AA aspartic protease
MMRGSVTDSLEAALTISLRHSHKEMTCTAILDTGITGFLTLPEDMIQTLGLDWLGREEAMLADGRTESFDVYRIAILWENAWRTVEVQAANVSPLLGMSLLEGHEIILKVIKNGELRISPIGNHASSNHNA